MGCNSRLSRISSKGQGPLLALLFTSLFTGACEEKEVKWVYERPPPNGAGKPEANSPDRLPPGALLEGPESAFGFAIPKGMTLAHPNRSTYRAEGAVNFDDLTSYVKDRITVRHAEMFGTRLVFPNAKIKGEENKVFDLTLREHRGRSILEIRDRTLLPTTPGLTETQRWEKAGFKVTNGSIDPKELE